MSERILQNRIQSPWLLADAEEMFMVGGSENKTIDDKVLRAGFDATVQADVSTGSHYILRYGRGGNVDRSVQYPQEDTRRASGKYWQQAVDGSIVSNNTIIIERWEKIPPGYKVLETSTEANDDSWMLPIYIRATYPVDVLPNTRAISSFTIQFFFDDTHWEPIVVAGTDQVAYELFPERIAREPGTLTATLVAANIITIAFNAAGAADRIRTQGSNKTPILKIPMRRLTPFADDVVSMGLSFGQAELALAGKIKTSEIQQDQPWTEIENFNAIFWQQASILSLRKDDPKGQSIDYAYKTPQLIDPQGRQTRLRDLFLRRLTHGHAASSSGAEFNAEAGQMNVLVASDWKDMSGQVIDQQTNNRKVIYKDDPRPRMQSGGALATRTFANEASWGDSANPVAGNYLVDNEQYDTVSLSTSIKGEHVSAMVYGHIRDKAEDVRINDIVAGTRDAGNRRRRGR